MQDPGRMAVFFPELDANVGILQVSCLLTRCAGEPGRSPESPEPATTRRQTSGTSRHPSASAQTSGLTLLLFPLDRSMLRRASQAGVPTDQPRYGPAPRPIGPSTEPFE